MAENLINLITENIQFFCQWTNFRNWSTICKN